MGTFSGDVVEETSLAETMRKAIADLDEVDDDSKPDDFRTLARCVKLTLVALSSSMGECQGDIPYSPMHPVRRPDGSFMWCCNHDPEHCS